MLREMQRNRNFGYANDPTSEKAILVRAGSGIPVLSPDGNQISRSAQVTRKFVAFPMADFVEMLSASDFENLIPHMYRDTGGNVTVGIGHLIPDADTAVALHRGPLPFSHRGSSDPATDADVVREYNAVHNEPGTNLGARAFFKITLLDTVAANARGLALATATSCLNKLLQSGRYPFFDTYPAEAQMVIIDMIYNLGQSGFFSKFPKFENAVKHRDWRNAKAESSRMAAGKHLRGRNLAIAGLLDAAANNPAESFFISTEPEMTAAPKQESNTARFT